MCIRSSFSSFPPYLTSLHFSSWLSSQNLHLGLHDINLLVTHFSDDESNGNNALDVQKFVKALQGRMNERRADIVEAAFCSIAGRRRNGGSSSEDEDVVPLVDFLRSFRAEEMPELKRGAAKDEDEARDMFLSRFRQCVCSGEYDTDADVVSFAQFRDYYSWLSSLLISDTSFVSVVSSTWGVTEFDSKSQTFLSCVKLLRDHAAMHVKGAGADKDPIKSERYLCSMIGHFDVSKSGYITVEQFLRGVKRINVSMTDEAAALFFERFGTRRGGDEGDVVIDYKDMCTCLYKS